MNKINKNIVTVTVNVKLNYEFNLWDAIKCRIAGLPYLVRINKNKPLISIDSLLNKEE